MVIAAAILTCFIVLATGRARTMYIWSTEAWFASPAYTLTHHGYPGTTIFEPAGTWLAGIERHTYWLPPVHLLLQAAWYEVFGFSLLTLRSLSIAAGVVTLACWCAIVYRLTGSRVIALLTLALTALDLRMVWISALGRADVTCAALGSLALLTYLSARGRSLSTAILGAHSLAAAACLTHPCGVLYSGSLVLLMLYYDRRRLGIRTVALIAAPYLAGLAAWGVYILQAPADFKHQFLGNMSGIATEFAPVSRWSEIRSPLRALKREFFLRYGFTFGWWSTGFSERIQLFPLFTYAAGIAACVLIRPLRTNAGCRALLLIGAFQYAVLALGDGLKSSSYVVHTMPVCIALLAICLAWARTRRLWAIIPIVTVFCACQLYSLVYEMACQPVREDYDNAVLFLRRSNAVPARIIAPGEFAFALQFDSGMKDDLRLGYFSGRRPEYIVANGIYQGWFARSAELYPPVHRYITELLRTQYRVVFQNSTYKIYRRI